ncbi:MAG: ABC transporter permease [Pseudomonadota bacterium]
MEFIVEGLLKAFQLLFQGDRETYSAVLATVKVSSISMTFSLTAGIPLGYLLGYLHFPGKKGLRTIVDTMLALPTVFVGLVVYAFISTRGPFGELGLLFTLNGIAIGQAILALPIVISLTATSVESLDRALQLTLKSLGASPLQIFRTTIWEARMGLVIAGITATGRVLTEVGVSMMVGGNIKWHTRTITTAIALETNKGQFATGIALGLVLLAMAFTINISLSSLRRRA